MNHFDLAVLGGGNMGRALIGGLLRQGMRPERVRVGERDPAACTALQLDFGLSATADNAAAVRGAQVVVLAVKPQDAGSVLSPLAAELARSRPIVLSVVAGVRLSVLQHWCGPQVPVLRAMPNRPALVGAGVTGLFVPPQCNPAHADRAEQILRAVGEVVRLDTEEALDVVTAISGSGPAYFFLLAEWLAQAGTDMGLPAAAARTLSVATLYGAGLLAHSGAGDLAQLRAQVTSKGGTTEAALRSFEAANFGQIVVQAAQAAAARSRQLAEQIRSA